MTFYRALVLLLLALAPQISHADTKTIAPRYDCDRAGFKITGRGPFYLINGVIEAPGTGYNYQVTSPDAKNVDFIITSSPAVRQRPRGVNLRIRENVSLPLAYQEDCIIITLRGAYLGKMPIVITCRQTNYQRPQPLPTPKTGATP